MKQRIIIAGLVLPRRFAHKTFSSINYSGRPFCCSRPIPMTTPSAAPAARLKCRPIVSKPVSQAANPQLIFRPGQTSPTTERGSTKVPDLSKSKCQWQAFTGQNATLQDDGLTYAIAQERIASGRRFD